MQCADDRETTDELGDQAIPDQIFRLDLLEGGPHVPVSIRPDVGAKPEALPAHAALDGLVQPHERAATDEQDVGRINLKELLMRMLAPTLRRDVGHRALEDLQQRLLDALAGDVACDRRVFVLPADLVHLVDIDDSLLALLEVPPGRLQELQDDILDIFTDVAGLGEGRRVDDRERDRQQLRQCLGQERLAGAGGPNQQDVRLGELGLVSVARLLLDLDPFVMVVDGDRQFFLRAFLANDVLVEKLLDILRHGQRGAPGAQALEPAVVGDDIVADLDALVADEHRRAGDQLPDVVLVLVAERAAEDLRVTVFLGHTRRLTGRSAFRLQAPGPDPPRVPYARFRTTSSMIPYSRPCSAVMM